MTEPQSSPGTPPAGLVERIAETPPPFDRERARWVLDELIEKAPEIEALLADERAQALLTACFGSSPYLGRLAIAEREALPSLFAEAPEATLVCAIAEAREMESAGDQASVMKRARQLKRQVALTVALADVAGAWTQAEAVAALSDFADAAAMGAARFLLRAEARRGKLPLDPDKPAIEEGSGYAILAMGKHGARELNYSSDIDLVIFFDEEALPDADIGALQDRFVRVTKGLVKILGEQNADGYVFRTDLRLRPDPGATQVAISMGAAEHYYESLGQNWERAAFIKARAAAGDIKAGADFLARLRPFIWRKHLDFASIADTHSIKRQIHAHKGFGGRIAAHGHDVKLGPGGIREIEFFVQTQQLIAGGRDPDLRAPTTTAALAALAEKGWIDEDARDALTQSYWWLRKLEHRIQMVDDQHTHALPGSDEGLERIANFMGFWGREEFSDALLRRLKTVQKHYSALFEKEAPLGGEGRLVFTGGENDPETLETLSGLGFARAGDAADAIRAWHHGRAPAMRSARARELLTQLTPALLASLGKTSDPDFALANFDRFLKGLPAGVQLFSLLYSNPRLLDLLSELMGAAPRLSSYLARNAGVIDALIDPGFFNMVERASEIVADGEAAIGAADHTEAKLDAARRFAKEAMFRVGVRTVRGAGDARAAGPLYAAIAEAAVRGLLPAAEAEVAARAGWVAGGAMAVVGLGKLGGAEMTATSDLDLMFIYDAPDLTAESDGARPLAASSWYGKAGQRLITALTTPTAEGALYEVDMRLRPSGNKGPVATSLETFIRYHAEDAWTWERMALTRARVIAGPAELRARLEAAIADALTAPRPAEGTLANALDMRARLEDEFGTVDPWRVKHVAGGLVDIEFIAQTLQLIHAHGRPEILDPSAEGALNHLARAGLLPAQDAEVLIRALAMEQRIAQIFGVAIQGEPDGEALPDGLRATLARAARAPSFEALAERLNETQSAVRALFVKHLGAPVRSPSP